jgi:hypothetical protein
MLLFTVSTFRSEGMALYPAGRSCQRLSTLTKETAMVDDDDDDWEYDDEDDEDDDLDDDDYEYDDDNDWEDDDWEEE